MSTPKHIILVHGAWADGSCWRYVVPMLSSQGLRVTALQLTLESFDNDVAVLNRVAQETEGDKIIVGHSYGGAVATALSPVVKNVRRLIYVAASAPGPGQPLADLMTLRPAACRVSTRIDGDGYVWAERDEDFRDAMGKDLADGDAQALFAAQKPVHSSIFSACIAEPSWKRFPSTYIVATRDCLFNPMTQWELADVIGAHALSCEAGHMVPLTRPDVIAQTILDAASECRQGG